MKQRLTLWWTRCSSRERTLLLSWTLVVLALLLWFAVLAPLNARIDQLERRLPELSTRLAAMRSQPLPERTAPGAARATGNNTAADLRSTLFRVLSEKKVSAELRALSPSRVEMRLPELPMPDALDLLDTLRREAAARIVVFNAKTESAASTGARLLVEFERAP